MDRGPPPFQPDQLPVSPFGKFTIVKSPDIPGEGSLSSRANIPGDLDAEPRLSWLLRQKVTVPDRIAGYVHRTRLVERALPIRRRLTVLKAPGGFGKTTLLAECCRQLSERGIVAAWVSLDRDDDAEVLDSYIAFAFQYAGVTIPELPADHREGGPDSRVGFLVRALEARGGPFVLALDDLQRLTDPGAVALLEFLLRRGPPNLHLAMACRHLPVGMNIGGAALEGRAAILTADELRFSKSETATFFDLQLSRRELASLMDTSLGWPMALRIWRNEANSPTKATAGDVQEFVENWVESRLWEGLRPDDRDFLLDVGLFEWIDAALLDEVLGLNDSMRRIQALRPLAGLLEPVGGSASDTWRLHSLIREHCTLQRFRDTPERFRAVHCRIAKALVRRGETILAMRHAADAGNLILAGEIFEKAGGIRLWIRSGVVQFQAADRLLNESVYRSCPRLGLAHCAALIFAGRLDEARQTYSTVAEKIPELAKGNGGADHELWVDERIVRGLLALYGCEPIRTPWVREVAADYARIAGSERTDPLIRGYMEHGLCIACNAKAEFAAAVEHAQRALTWLHGSRYAQMLVEFQLGQAAMAQGEVSQAHGHYTQATRVAKVDYMHDPASAAIANVLLQELELERNRYVPSSEPPRIPGPLIKNGTPFSAYAAAAGVVADVTLHASGVDGGLAALEEMLDYVRGTELPTLTRYISALRISMLAAAERLSEAERAWSLAELPTETQACLDLTDQTWREMEALACARLRLFIETGEFDAGRGFASELRNAAGARSLVRTQMRALALSIALEQRAGAPTVALGYLSEYLHLFAKADYARPLVHDRRDCAPIVAAFLDTAVESPERNAAEFLWAAMRRADSGSVPTLSEREREVLQRLPEHGDKEIAVALGLSPMGVRYHIRNLFTKLGARTRGAAVRRARDLGLLPEES